MSKLGEFMHFRCHTETLEVTDLVTFLQKETDLLMIVREFGKKNREHIHATLILKTAKSTFVDRLKKSFPTVVGNGSYGLKAVRDFDKNARYTYKGAPNDYPDILFTTHSETEWKDYYKRYWEEFTKLHKKEVNTGCQNGSFFEAEVKPKSKAWSLKVSEELWEDHRPLFASIWYHHGAKDYTPIDNLKDNQDYLADYLLKKLGTSAKILDKFIFERLYRGVYNYILCKCPENLTHKPATKMLDAFRHEL